MIMLFSFADEKSYSLQESMYHTFHAFAFIFWDHQSTKIVGLVQGQTLGGHSPQSPPSRCPLFTHKLYSVGKQILGKFLET